MRSNKKFHIAITSHKLENYICRLARFCHNFCTLQNRSIDEPFKSICTANILDVVNDSDENKYLEKSNATSWKKMILAKKPFLRTLT